MKAWAWNGWRRECLFSWETGHQTREVIAAPTPPANAVEAATDEREAAMRSPGVVLWRPLHGGEWRPA